MPELVRTVSDLRAIQALAQPMRVRVLEALRHPESAASVARRLGEPRQKVNYHLKELVRVGLARHAGERRKGNFIEQLYEAAARRFVISSALTADTEQVQRTLRDQVSLAHLAALGERLQQDAAGLLDLAAYEGMDVPSATIEADIRFADARDRAAFMEAYLAAVGPLLKQFGVKPGDSESESTSYRVAVAVYPELDHGTEPEERS